jgi:hypothetical protein
MRKLSPTFRKELNQPDGCWGVGEASRLKEVRSRFRISIACAFSEKPLKGLNNLKVRGGTTAAGASDTGDHDPIFTRGVASVSVGATHLAFFFCQRLDTAFVAFSSHSRSSESKAISTAAKYLGALGAGFPRGAMRS